MHKRKIGVISAVVILVLASGVDGRNRAPKPVGATVTDWRAIKVYELNGVDAHARVEDHPELRVTSFTLTAWVNSTEIERMQPIVAKAQAKGNWNSYMLRIQDGGRLSLAIDNHADGTDAHWRTKSKLTSKRWHHVAATWSNECGKASDAKLYIDGVEQETEMNRNVGYGPKFRLGYTAEPLYIGRDEFPSGHFMGTLRDVDVVGRVLSPAEIKQLVEKASAKQ